MTDEGGCASSHRRPGRNRCWSGRSGCDAAVCLIAVLAAGPYALMSPNYLREDFDSLLNAARNGALGAAGPAVARPRPGAAAVFALVFGGLGGRPVWTVLLMTAVHAGHALLLFHIASRMLTRRTAFAVAALWAILPTSSALTHWASAAPVGFALMLLMVSILLMWRSPLSTPTAAAAVVLLVASALTYEAVIPIGVAAAFLVPKLATRRFNPRFSAVCVVALGGVGLWNLVTTTKRDLSPLSANNAIHGHFGSELIKVAGAGRATVVAVVVAVVWSGARLALPHVGTGVGERLVVAGAGVVVLGTLPFIGVDREIDYVMQGDRATAVSGVGTALVLVGIGLLLSGNRWSVWIFGTTLVSALCATVAINHVAYSRSSRQVHDLLLAVDHQVRPGDTHVVVVVGHVLGCDGVEAIDNDDNLRVAVEWYLDRRFDSVRLAGPDVPGVDAAGTELVDLRGLSAICGSPTRSGVALPLSAERVGTKVGKGLD